jgi:hypothetical protein
MVGAEMVKGGSTTRTKTYGSRHFDQTASTLWNNIQLQLKTAFKSCLKTYLFKQAFRDKSSKT